MQASDNTEIARINTSASIASDIRFFRRVAGMGKVRSSTDQRYSATPAETIPEQKVDAQRRRLVLSITRPDGSEVLAIYAQSS